MEGAIYFMNENYLITNEYAKRIFERLYLDLDKKLNKRYDNFERLFEKWFLETDNHNRRIIGNIFKCIEFELIDMYSVGSINIPVNKLRDNNSDKEIRLTLVKIFEQHLTYNDGKSYYGNKIFTYLDTKKNDIRISVSDELFFKIVSVLVIKSNIHIFNSLSNIICKMVYLQIQYNAIVSYIENKCESNIIRFKLYKSVFENMYDNVSNEKFIKYCLEELIDLEIIIDFYDYKMEYDIILDLNKTIF
ncbi:hypothetical protein [Clostridium sp.]|uniref:hypothetical protein n=1 Tax=Clostridium sp. TaxID=1506 RepID=UPI002FC7C4BB